ncbi:hypothetical protein HY439_00025, partial [Candidatus Microgenomates bacterium]|nr:hypothetical protein [Candidatus Microgenomates bacterium]
MKRLLLKLMLFILVGVFLMKADPVKAVYENYVNNILSPATITTETQGVQQELETKVAEIVSLGHMAPTIYFIGLGQNPIFYTTPAETIYTLSTAYPYLSASLKTSVKSYLDQEIVNYPPHSTGYYPPNNGKVSNFVGAKREYFTPNPNQSFNFWPGPAVHISALYAVWLYSQNTGDWTYVNNNYTSLKSRYTSFKTGGAINSYPELAGVVGFARIAQHQGNTADYNDALAFAESGFAAGVNLDQFLATAKTNYPNTGMDFTTPLFLFSKMPTAAFFNRDIGTFLKDKASTQASAYAAQITSNVPLAWLVGPSLVQGEHAYATPEISWTYFMLRSYVLNDSAAVLKGYLDKPDRKGDLFYIQKLVATIEAPSTGGTVTPTPTPTPASGVCSLSSASWSKATAIQGQSVGLTASTTGTCTGKSVKFEVRRNGTLFDDIAAQIQPNDSPITSGVATGSWVAEYNP